jgi:predicted SAM-dependent methyltransferase
MRLNLGAGNTAIEGFEPRDVKRGDSIYPLPDEDGSVEEIRASHVLEHFSHRDVSAVVNHWVAKLVPGGLLRIAVPDFGYVAKEYLAGRAINVQGYLMGGHVDDDDRHGCAFDAEVLEEILLAAGLERLHHWMSEVEDCASLPVSLNLGGYKPSGPAKHCINTTAVLSAPRFGPVTHFRCALNALTRARVPYYIGGGAYWHQVMSELLEEQLQREGTQYIITCDYDTVFGYEDVLELYRLMEAVPQADAICALQSKRGCDQALFGVQGKDGRPVTSIPGYQLERHLFPVSVGHFGLTIFRAATLREHQRPWMEPVANPEGRWTDGKVDADIDFWRRWSEAGRTLYLAPRVVVGHLQELVTWPGKDLKPIYQTVSDFHAGGMPQEARR